MSEEGIGLQVSLKFDPSKLKLDFDKIQKWVDQNLKLKIPVEIDKNPMEKFNRENQEQNKKNKKMWSEVTSDITKLSGMKTTLISNEEVKRVAKIHSGLGEITQVTQKIDKKTGNWVENLKKVKTYSADTVKSLNNTMKQAQLDFANKIIKIDPKSLQFINFNKVNELQNKLNKLSIDSPTLKQDIKLINSELEQVILYAKRATNELNQVGHGAKKPVDMGQWLEVERGKLGNKLSGIEGLFKEGMRPELLLRLEELRTKLSTITPSMANVQHETKLLGNDIRKLEIDTRIASKGLVTLHGHTLSLGDAFKQAMLKFPVWMLATTAFYGTIAGIKNLINTSALLEEQLANIRKLLPNQEDADQVMKVAFQIGKAWGGSLDGILEQAQEWSRQTKDPKQIGFLTNLSQMLSTATDIQQGDSVKVLSAIMAQWKLTGEQVYSVGDKINEVTNRFRTNAVDLAQGLSKTGSIAKEFGMDFDQMLGLVTAGVQALGVKGNEIGTALKTIFSRNYKKDAKDALGKIGIDSMQSLGKVISQLGSKWSGLDKGTKIMVAQALAGTHHYGRLITIMENYKNIVEKVSDVSKNQSKGSLFKEASILAQTFSNRLEALKTSYKEFIYALNDSTGNGGILAFPKMIITGLTGALSTLTLLIQKLEALPPAQQEVIKSFLTLSSVAIGATVSLKAFTFFLNNTGYKSTAESIDGITNALTGLIYKKKQIGTDGDKPLFKTSGLLPAIGSMIDFSPFDLFKGKLRSLNSDVDIEGRKIGSTFMNALNPRLIVSNLRSGLSQIPIVLANAFNMNTVKTSASKIGSIFASIGSFLINPFRGIKNVFSGLVTFMTNIFNKIPFIAEKGLGRISGFLAIAIVAIAAFKKAWESNFGKIRQVISSVLASFEGLFSQFITTMGDVWNGIKTVWNGITQSFTKGGKTTGTIFAKVFAWIGAVLINWATLVSGILKGVSLIFQGEGSRGVALMGQSIAKGLFRVGALYYRFVSGVGKTLAQLAKVGVEAGLGLVKGLWNALKSNLTNLGKALWSWIQSGMKGGFNFSFNTTGIKTSISGVVDYFKSEWGDANKWVDDTMANVGKGANSAILEAIGGLNVQGYMNTLMSKFGIDDIGADIGGDDIGNVNVPSGGGDKGKKEDKSKEKLDELKKKYAEMSNALDELNKKTLEQIQTLDRYYELGLITPTDYVSQKIDILRQKAEEIVKTRYELNKQLVELEKERKEILSDKEIKNKKPILVEIDKQMTKVKGKIGQLPALEKKASDEWNNYKNTVEKAMKPIDELKEKINSIVEKVKDIATAFTEAINNVRTKLKLNSLFGSEFFGTSDDIFNSITDAYREKYLSYYSFIDELQNTNGDLLTKINNLKAKQTNKTITKEELAQLDSLLSTEDVNKVLEKYKLTKEEFINFTDAQLKSIISLIDKQNQEKLKAEEVLNSYEKELQTIEDKVQEQERLNQLKEKELKISEIQAEIDKVKLDKRFELIDEQGRKTLTYDVAKVNELETQKLEAENDLREYKYQQDVENQKKAIQQKIDLQREYIEKELPQQHARELSLYSQLWSAQQSGEEVNQKSLNSILEKGITERIELYDKEILKLKELMDLKKQETALPSIQSSSSSVDELIKSAMANSNTMQLVANIKTYGTPVTKSTVNNNTTLYIGNMKFEGKYADAMYNLVKDMGITVAANA